MSRTFYRRHLPHWQPPGATFHVTFRLDGSLPRHAVEELRQRREEMEKELTRVKDTEAGSRLRKDFRWKIFEKFEALLDGESRGPHWMNKPEIGEIVRNALHYYDRVRYDLIAFCVMPNHVHVIITSAGSPEPTSGDDGKGDGSGVPSNLYVVSEIFGSIKKYTARRASRILHRSGAFWQDESYDHVIRTQEELERTIEYVLNNPVKAGLVNSWEEWRWSYIKPELIE